MVIRSLPILLATVALITAVPTPAPADSILEQMQKEISGVARRTRRAVVTLEPADAQQRVGMNQFDVKVDFDAQNDEKTRAEAERIIQQATEKIAKYSREIAELSRQYSKNDARVKAAQKSLDEASKEIQRATEKLQKSLQVRPNYIVRRAVTAGNGFAIGEGYIVTTADALTGTDTITVVTDSGKRLKAHVVGMHREHNVGLVKLDENADLPALKLGDSGAVEEGHFALTLSGRSRQSRGLTLGTISRIQTEGIRAGERFYASLFLLPETTNAISGTPMLNASGEVIGLMVAGANQDYYNWRGLFQDNSPWLHVWPQGSVQGFGGGFGGDADLFLPAQPENREEQNTRARDRKREADGKTLPKDTEVRTDRYRQAVTPLQPFASAVAGRTIPLDNADAAIPINDIKAIIENLKAGRKTTSGWFGINPAEAINGIVFIQSVYAESPAANAGLKPGDVIETIDGREVENANALRSASTRLKVGDKVEMTVKPNGGRGNAPSKRVTLTITARPDNPRILETHEVASLPEPLPARPRVPSSEPSPLPARPAAPRRPGASTTRSWIGIQCVEEQQKIAMSETSSVDKNWVIIDSVYAESPAAKAGLRPGDILLEVNKKSVDDIGDFTEVGSQLVAGREVTLIILRPKARRAQRLSFTLTPVQRPENPRVQASRDNEQ